MLSKGLSKKRASIAARKIQRNRLNTKNTIPTNTSLIVLAEDTSLYTDNFKEEKKEDCIIKRKSDKLTNIEMIPYDYELDKFIDLLIRSETSLDIKRNLLIK